MSRLNNKIKQALIMLGVCGLTFSTGASANGFCGYSTLEDSYLDTINMHNAGLINDADFSNWMHAFGGVTLNKTLTLLNDYENIRGATFDPTRGEVIFVGEEYGSGVPVEEKIDMDDLVVAMQSVFAMQQDPGITFYTQDRSSAFQTGLWDVTYFGATKDRKFGQILFDADYLLKQLSLGIDPSGNRLDITYSQLSGLNYKSFAERLFKDNLRVRDNDDNALAVEFWFAPKTVTLAETDDSSNDRAFVFREVSMEVFPRILDESGNEAVQGTYDSRILTHAQAFADNITNNYSAYAEIPGFTVLKKLERLGKITGLVRWLRDNGIPVDMSFMRDYKPQQVPATPATVGILQVCKDATTGGITSDGSGPYSWTTLCNMQIQGGITYDLENGYPDAAGITAGEVADLALLTDVNIQDGRAVDPTDMTQKMKWNATSLSLSDGTSDLLAVAQTLARSEKDGNQSFTSVDLAFPNLSGQPLAFTRYYDSSSNVGSGFGPGWSELPFELQFLGGRSEYDGSDLDGNNGRTIDANNPPSYAFSQIMVVDHLSGKIVPFYRAGEITWTTDTDQNYYSAYFASDRSNDFISEHVSGGTYLYEKRDANGQTVKKVFFRELAYDGITHF